MARHHGSSAIDAAPAIFIIAIVTAWRYKEWLLYVFLIVVTHILIAKIVKFLPRGRSKDRDVDAMDGFEFEEYVAELLSKHGYTNIALTEQYDMGVDIIAEKDGFRWGIQVKRYNGPVKAAAVRQVVTALRFYGCNRSMVITNSFYSQVAQRLADSNGCVLIDRPVLLKMAH